MRPTYFTGPTKFLTGLTTLMLIVVGIAMFLLVSSLFSFGPDRYEVGVHTQVPGSHVTGLPHGALPPHNLDVIVRVRHAIASQVRWVAARDLAPGLLLVAALWLLRQLVRSVREGEPFTEANARRRRVLGLITLAGVPLATLVASWCASELAKSTHLRSAGIHLSIPGGVIVGGLGAFVLAEVFAAGVRLRADLEGTV